MILSSVFSRVNAQNFHEIERALASRNGEPDKKFQLAPVPRFGYHPPCHFVASGIEKRLQKSGRNGVVKKFNYMLGTPDTHIQFTNRSFEAYTLFHLCRYVDEQELLVCVSSSSSKRNRILTSARGDWISGFWQGHDGVAYESEDWIAPPRLMPDSDSDAAAAAASPPWILSTHSPQHYRRNGVGSPLRRSTDPAHHLLPPFGINFNDDGDGGGDGGGGDDEHDVMHWERSHFAFADMLLFDRVLSLSEVETVENVLANEYGILEILEA